MRALRGVLTFSLALASLAVAPAAALAASGAEPEVIEAPTGPSTVAVEMPTTIDVSQVPVVTMAPDPMRTGPFGPVGEVEAAVAVVPGTMLLPGGRFMTDAPKPVASGTQTLIELGQYLNLAGETDGAVVVSGERTTGRARSAARRR